MSKKILIIRLGAIGDVVHSTVIQQSIKEKYPDCKIHFMTSETIAPLLEYDTNIEKVYRFISSKKDNLFYLITLGLTFRKEKYDVIINLQNSLRNRFLTFLANPKRLVFRSKIRRHAIDAFFNSAKEIFEDIAKPVNLKLHFNPKTLEAIENKIKDYKRPFIIISPGGENDNSRQGRIWPADSWIKLCNSLIETYGGSVFVIGSPAEKDRHKVFLNIKNAVLFSGQLNLEESACLFSKADLFISGDSGPLHMASALDVKTIGIMGSTPDWANGPYGEKGYAVNPDYECSGCGEKTCCKLTEGEIYTPCISSITPEKVYNFIKENNLLG